MEEWGEERRERGSQRRALCHGMFVNKEEYKIEEEEREEGKIVKEEKAGL